jgi:predicted transcriptional regulator
VLLSVRPRHAEAILDGRKTVEVRRQPVRARPGSAILIYATSPTRAIVGLASIASTIRASADAGWREHEASLGIDRDELDAYLDGRVGSFLRLERVTALPTPLALADLRNGHPFRPPRSYRYIAPDDPAVLRDLAASATARITSS